MGATKPKHPKKHRKHLLASNPAPVSATTLLAQSASLLQTGDPVSALGLAQKAAEVLSPSGIPSASSLPALTLLGEINIELGDTDSAREVFLASTKVDSDGTMPEANGGGAEKFMWMAQLSEKGGKDSIMWYEKGVNIIHKKIAVLEEKPDATEEIEDKKRKLASALCGMIEVWMTDLSFETEAEAQCESLITRALMISSTANASTLQTLASIRLSQNRLEDAESALNRSMEQWKGLPLDHPERPDFPTRISLSRLLMEAGMEDKALEVVEVLVGEDDQSIEAWYLGGWCLHLMATKAESENSEDKTEQKTLFLSSREWLRNCLKLYRLLDYEDERLYEHAKELVTDMDKELGHLEIEDGEDDDEWVDEGGSSSDGDEDCNMNGM